MRFLQNGLQHVVVHCRYACICYRDTQVEIKMKTSTLLRQRSKGWVINYSYLNIAYIEERKCYARKKQINFVAFQSQVNMFKQQLCEYSQ